jgi:hypothetical protein
LTCFSNFTILPRVFSPAAEYSQPDIRHRIMLEDEENIVPDEKDTAKGQQKPQQTSRKKLENYLEELELKKQLDDFYDLIEDDDK